MPDFRMFFAHRQTRSASPTRLALAIGALLLATSAPAQDAPQASADEPPFFLGVQTHFAQGWDLNYLKMLPNIDTPHLRDDASWHYFYDDSDRYGLDGTSPNITTMGRAGLAPLIVFPGSTPHEDAGKVAHSDAGRAALADFVVRVLKAHPETVKRIEIGNELNSLTLSDDFRADPVGNTAKLVSTVAAAARAAEPDVEILCTGAHSVATGFLRAVFETGAFENCDAISFHPYRGDPENLGAEIRHLRALVDEFGGAQRLYVTEFGKEFDDPNEAPDYMLKMVSQMGAAGLSGAYWYALLNEPMWPNMGLFHADGREMPAASAFRFLQTELLPLGRPTARAEPGTHHIYEFGSEGRAFVTWGPPGELIVDGPAQFFDSAGRPIGPVATLSVDPVVILGNGLQVRVERQREIYSAYFGYGTAPWSYLAHRPDGVEVPFDVMEWNWGPYLGHPHLNPMKVTVTSVDAAVFNDEPYYAVERFTAPDTGSYEITGRWVQPQPDTDGVDIRISLNGALLASGIATATPFVWSMPAVNLSAGDRLDFAVGPNASAGNDWVDREITVVGP